MFKNFYNWIKKKIVWLFVGGIVLAGGLTYGDLTKDEVSLEKIVAKYEQATEIKTKYQIDNASLVKTDIKNPELDKYKNEPKDEIKITLGDKDKAEFVPNIELKRWNEVSFKIKPNLEGVATKDKDLKFEGDKIKFSTPKISFEMYDYAEGEGGMKFIWYLNEKPATNKVEFQIESSGLDFFYQPELTPEEIAQGAERPENVVGSYAVYHSTKGGMNDINGKEYKVGKAFHIFRPRIIDAEGKETWGILKIENGIYSEEIPPEWNDKAVYPIRSNATFGYTTIGSGNLTSMTIDSPAGARFTSPADAASGVSISSYISSSAGGNGNFKGLLVNSVALTIVSNGIGGAAGFTGTLGWATSTFSGAPTISPSTAYLLANITDTMWNTKWDNGTTNQECIDSTNSYSSPVDLESCATSRALIYSIYATYTPAEDGAAVPEVQQFLWEE